MLGSVEVEAPFELEEPMLFCLLFTDFRDGKCVNVNVRAYRYRVASKSEHHNEHFSLV